MDHNHISFFYNFFRWFHLLTGQHCLCYKLNQLQHSLLFANSLDFYRKFYDRRTFNEIADDGPKAEEKKTLDLVKHFEIRFLSPSEDRDTELLTHHTIYRTDVHFSSLYNSNDHLINKYYEIFHKHISKGCNELCFVIYL